MNLGVRLLRKLGLTEAEEIKMKSIHHSDHVFARDLQGIGYTGPKSALPDLDDAFARLNAIASISPAQAPKIEIKAVQSPFFIPSKLKKKDVNSFSNEDLTSIFIQSNISEKSSESEESNQGVHEKRRRRRHHSSEQEVETNQQQNNEQTESVQQSNTQTQENEVGSEAPTEVHHRRRHRKHTSEQPDNS